MSPAGLLAQQAAQPQVPPCTTTLAPRAVPCSARSAPVRWVQGDALALPFGSGAFDAATMGYGLRNVADIPQVRGGARRAMK